MDNNGKTAVAFLLGVITGGVLGVMFAPKSGKETRADVQRYIKTAEAKLHRKSHGSTGNSGKGRMGDPADQE